jgi:MinD-like ATPase involved in chromosome partitioning or flagellar assembly
MNEMARQFLGVTAGFAGFIPEDRAVKHAVATQKSLAVAVPESTACRQVSRLAQAVTSPYSNSIADSQAVPMTQINKTTATADIRG